MRLTGNMLLTKYVFCGFLSSSLPLLNDEKNRVPKNQKDAGRRKALFRCSTENGGVLRLSRMFEVPPQICVFRVTEFFLNISRIFAPHTQQE